MCDVRSAEATHYNRLDRRRSFTQTFQHLQHQDAKVVDRLRHQKQVSDKLRHFLAAAESRDYNYKSRLCGRDAAANFPFEFFSLLSEGFGQKVPWRHSSTSPPKNTDSYGHLAPDQSTQGSLGLRGGRISPSTQNASDHSRRKYQKHHYAITRLQKKLHASEQQEDALEIRLSQIRRRTESCRHAWQSEQDRVCKPSYSPPPPPRPHQHSAATGRKDSGTWTSHDDTLVQLAVGAVQSATMYGTAVGYVWQDLLTPPSLNSAWYDSFSGPEDILQNSESRSHRFSGATLVSSSNHDLDNLEASFPVACSPDENLEAYTDHPMPPGSPSIPRYAQCHRSTSESDDFTETLDQRGKLDAELQDRRGQQRRMSLAAEEDPNRQAAAHPVLERYDEVAAGDSRSRRRLNRSYSTDDLELVRRYNERHMLGQ